MRSTLDLPHPKPLHFWFGNTPNIVKNKHRRLDWVSDQHALLNAETYQLDNPFFENFKRTNFIVTSNVANVEHILKGNFKNYPKGERLYKLLGGFLGHGIFTSDGEQWKAQRKIAANIFTINNFKNLFTSVFEGRVFFILKKKKKR